MKGFGLGLIVVLVATAAGLGGLAIMSSQIEPPERALRHVLEDSRFPQ